MIRSTIDSSVFLQPFAFSCSSLFCAMSMILDLFLSRCKSYPAAQSVISVEDLPQLALSC